MFLVDDMLASLGAIGSAIGQGAETLASGVGSASGGLGSLFSSLGSAGSGEMIKMLTGDYFGRKQRSRQAALSYELTNYEAALNYQYSKLYNQQNYALAQRYAENSAKWAVTGLRNANLNPVLAAGGGFNANMGQAGVSADTGIATPSLNSNPAGADVISALRGLASTKQTESSAKQMDSQAELNEKSESLVEANAAKSAAEADSIKVKTDAEALNTLQNVLRQGDKSWLGTLFKTTAGETPVAKSALDSIDRIVTHLGSRFGSSAKDTSSSARVYEKVREQYPLRHSAKPTGEIRMDEAPKHRNSWFTDHSQRSIFNQHGNWSR